jgi:hypothetical protein
MLTIGSLSPVRPSVPIAENLEPLHRAWNERLLVEAVGIESCCGDNPNLLTEHDFGFSRLRTSELPHHFDCFGVPYSPLESPSLGNILETQGTGDHQVVFNASIHLWKSRP